MKPTLVQRFLVLTGLFGCYAAVATADEPSASAASPVAAAPAPVPGKPEFRGILTTSKEKRFLLSTPGATHDDWAVLGGSFQGWKLAEYEDASGTLLLQKPDGSELKLTLAGKHLAGTDVKATIKDAQRVLNKMHFNEMLAKILEQQRQAMAQMMAQQRRGKLPPGTTEAEMAEFQQKVLDKLWGGIKGSDMEQDVAKIYSNVFTPDELDGLADFYDTPTGQALIAKQPLVQQQMMQTMMPRIMAMQPEIQKMQQEFTAQHAAQAAAAAGGASAAVSASAPAATPTPTPGAAPSP
jgi:hypothetical protein